MFFSKSYFDKVFKKPSPWGYATSEYERVKYYRQLEAIKQHYPEPKDILEVGCAEGIYTVMMAEAFPHARILSVDISPNAINKAMNNCRSYPNIELRELDIVKTLKTGSLQRSSFDIIVQSECLYYLLPDLLIQRNVVGYVRELTSTLREDAIFITSNGLTGTSRLVMGLYYSIFKRFCAVVHTAKYREWNEYRNRFITYDMKIFRYRKSTRKKVKFHKFISTS